MLKRAVTQDPIHRAAYIISLVLNPTTLGFVAVMVFSLTFGGSTVDSIVLFTVSFLFCVLLPFLYLVYLKKTETIDSLDVPIRDQRTIPYLLAIVSYTAGFFLLWHMSAPWQLIALLASYLGNTLFVMIVNMVWKISAHAMGVGAVVTAFALVLSPAYFVGLVLLPLVSWSRIRLEMHSRGQVIAGSVFSVILTACWFELVFRFYH